MEAMTVHAAKTNLSKLLAQVLHGQEVVFGRGGKPEARITAYQEPSERKKPRRFGGEWTGKVWYAPDYDEADALIEKMFNESKIFPKE